MTVWRVSLKMNDLKALNLLGLARRAGKISLGHDASEAQIKAGGAYACIVSGDASERLKNEMESLCSANKTKLIRTEYTMNELGMCLGSKMTAVLTVNDRGFAERFNELIGRNTDI